MKIPNSGCSKRSAKVSLARIVSEDSQPAYVVSALRVKSSKDS